MADSSFARYLGNSTVRMGRRRLIGLAAAGAAGLALGPSLAGCGEGGLPVLGEQPADQTPRRGGTLRIGLAALGSTLDPALNVAIGDTQATLEMYNNLVRLDSELRIQPDLAESWDISDDLKAWTFTLRENVKFHHGKAFGADDVVYTFTRVLDPETGSAGRSYIPFVEGVEKIDDHTARFYLKQPHADLVGHLAGGHMRIVPADRDPDQIVRDPSGTGPFRFKELSPGERAVFVRNNEYWEPGLPYLDEVQHLAIPEGATRVAALAAGTIDVNHQLDLHSVSAVEADPDCVVVELAAGAYQPLVMLADRPPFNDNRLRQAMKLAIDRPGMRQALLMGRGSLANDQPVPPINPYYAGLKTTERNIERARGLMREAGYPDGIDLTLYTSPGRANLVEQAVAVQEMAEPVGFRLKIEQVPITSYWADYWMKKELCFSNWALRPTIDETLALPYHSQSDWNEAFIDLPHLDYLIEDARAEGDAEKRKQMYAEAQRVLMEEGGSMIAYFAPNIYATRKSIHGLETTPNWWMYTRWTWLAE